MLDAFRSYFRESLATWKIELADTVTGRIAFDEIAGWLDKFMQGTCIECPAVDQQCSSEEERTIRMTASIAAQLLWLELLLDYGLKRTTNRINAREYDCAINILNLLRVPIETCVLAYKA